MTQRPHYDNSDAFPDPRDFNAGQGLTRVVNPLGTGLQGPGDVNAIAGWWSNTNGLGQDRLAEFPNREGQIIQVAGVDALGPPAPFTVSLHADYVFGDAANCGLRARIEFGAGASAKSVLCDFANGTQFAIAASGFCRITAVSYAPDPAAPYRAGTSTYRIGGSIGHSTGAHPQPYFTQRLVQLPSGDASPLIVPPTWAESVQLQLMQTSEDLADPYVAAVKLRFFDSTGNIFSVVPSTRFPQSFVPIPMGSRVDVINGVVGASRTATLIWRLAL